MRKLILSAALAALSLSAVTQAHAAGTSGWFANAAVGSNHFSIKDSGYSYSDNATSWMVNGGWRKGMVGFEVGYTDLGSMTKGVGLGSVKLSADGPTVGLNLHYNVNDKFYVGGRAGAFFWTAKETLTQYGYGSMSTNDSSTGFYAGVGAGYNFTPNWSLGANYNYYRMSKSGTTVDNDMFAVSLEYSF